MARARNAVRAESHSLDAFAIRHVSDCAVKISTNLKMKDNEKGIN